MARPARLLGAEDLFPFNPFFFPPPMSTRDAVVAVCLPALTAAMLSDFYLPRYQVSARTTTLGTGYCDDDDDISGGPQAPKGKLSGKFSLQSNASQQLIVVYFVTGNTLLPVTGSVDWQKGPSVLVIKIVIGNMWFIGNHLLFISGVSLKMVFNLF